VSPTAAIIDSQSAEGAQKGAPRLTRNGLVRARRSPGASARSWSIRSCWTSSFIRADIQDRDGARLVLDRRIRCLFPFIARIFVDAGYQGLRAARAAASTRSGLEIVKRNELHKFVVLPRRWIVERTLAWISRNRRLARDFERYARTVATCVRLAMIRIMLRCVTRTTSST